jgi:hypothetical protein
MPAFAGRTLHQANAAQILTGGTGGTIFPFVRQKGLEEAIQKLGSELHSQYVISFVQEDTTAGHHNLDVRAAVTLQRRGGWRSKSVRPVRT